MVFKRRDRRGVIRYVSELLWPRGGWKRAAMYVSHRLNRLPDPPHRIARGIFAGVFVTFTPFYGLHFFMAAGLALIMRGNVLASLLATFFGNPLTYVPIGVVALKTGHWLLGNPAPSGDEVERKLGQMFLDAGLDLRANIAARFTGEAPNWDRLHVFYDQVFFPYMIGGLIPGIITALIFYYISVPVISAYQNRRKGMLKAKLAALKKKAQLVRDEDQRGR